ncbi:hypothetical protein OPV22_018740 [Ensete ventricosum]|uniref:Uncharacterized protein n=1 Tax=Ensete ventricosum TaxID=4639 RepID=A0AAV8R2N0_ENSVE|nr:hypothetical protein OPV22_018740 [Ensete ventricosum]
MAHGRAGATPCPQSRPKWCNRQSLQFQSAVDTGPPWSARPSRDGQGAVRVGPRGMARYSERIRCGTSGRVRYTATHRYPGREGLYPVSGSDRHPLKMNRILRPRSFRFRARDRIGRWEPRG